VSQRLAECCCVSQTGGGGGCDVCPKWPSSFSCLIQVSGTFRVGQQVIPFGMSDSMIMEIERCPDGTGGKCSFASRVTLNHPLYDSTLNDPRCTQLPWNGAIATIRADSGYVDEFGYKYRVAAGVLGCSLTLANVTTQSNYELIIAFGIEDETVSPYFGPRISRQVLSTGNPSNNNASIPWTCCQTDQEVFTTLIKPCWNYGGYFPPYLSTTQSVTLKNPCDLPNGVYSGLTSDGWNVTATIS